MYFPRGLRSFFASCRAPPQYWRTSSPGASTTDYPGRRVCEPCELARPLRRPEPSPDWHWKKTDIANAADDTARTIRRMTNSRRCEPPAETTCGTLQD